MFVIVNMWKIFYRLSEYAYYLFVHSVLYAFLHCFIIICRHQTLKFVYII
jgi:hypothetical protein